MEEKHPGRLAANGVRDQGFNPVGSKTIQQPHSSRCLAFPGLADSPDKGVQPNLQTKNKDFLRSCQRFEKSFVSIFLNLGLNWAFKTGGTASRLDRCWSFLRSELGTAKKFQSLAQA